MVAAVDSAGPCTPERTTDVAARTASYSAQRTPQGCGAGAYERHGGRRSAQQQPCKGSDSSGEDTLSMTGLIDSGSSDGKQPCKLPENSAVQGWSTGEHRGDGRVEAARAAGSESPSAGPRRRQAAAFLASAPFLAAAAMSLAHVSSEDEGYVTPWHASDRASSRRGSDHQLLNSDASEGSAYQASQCDGSSGRSGSPGGSSTSEELLLERELPALSLHDSNPGRALCNAEEAALDDVALKVRWHHLSGTMHLCAAYMISTFVKCNITMLACAGWPPQRELHLCACVSDTRRRQG